MNSLNIKPWVLYALLPFVGGLLYPLGFPFWGDTHFMPFAFLGVFLFLLGLPLAYGQPSPIAATSKTLKRILITTLLFGLGYCLLGYYWIPYTLKEFGNIPFPFNNLLGTAFSLIIVPHYLVFGLIIFLWRKLNLKKSSLAAGVSTRNLIYALLLVLLEKMIPQQFPAHIGHVWLQLKPFLGLTPIFGAAVYSLISYLLILFFVSWIKTGKRDFYGLALALILSVISFLNPLSENKTEEKLTTHIRMVQANIGNFMKLDSEKGGLGSMREIYRRYETQSSLKPEEKIDLIIWPETAYPQLINSAMMRLSPAFVPSVVRRTAQNMNAHLFFGGYDKSGNDNNYYFETEYNAAFLINPEGELDDLYHKMILIPFGESLPFGPFNPLFAKVLENLAFFAKGTRFTQFKLPNGAEFISAICYEILFSQFIRTYLNKVPNKPHFLVNLTNDSWYGRTSEPYQHKFLAHWRALEFQIPIVRMTNTGISSILFADGNESERIPLFKNETKDYALRGPKKPQRTFYQHWGYIPLTLMGLLFFFGAWILEKGQTRDPL